MSKIRLWKLGSLEHRIFPTKAVADRLSNILANISDDEEITDIIWDPAIEVEVVDGDDDVIIASTDAAIALLESQGYSVLKPLSEYITKEDIDQIFDGKKQA